MSEGRNTVIRASAWLVGAGTVMFVIGVVYNYAIVVTNTPYSFELLQMILMGGLAAGAVGLGAAFLCLTHEEWELTAQIIENRRRRGKW